jgi:hypothetical protein
VPNDSKQVCREWSATLSSVDRRQLPRNERLDQVYRAVGVRAGLAQVAVVGVRVERQLDDASGLTVGLGEALGGPRREDVVVGALDQQRRRQLDLLAPLEDLRTTATPANRAVNRAGVEGPELIVAAEEAEPLQLRLG